MFKIISTTKTGRHDTAEILLKMALHTINQIKSIFDIWILITTDIGILGSPAEAQMLSFILAYPFQNTPVTQYLVVYVMFCRSLFLLHNHFLQIYVLFLYTYGKTNESWKTVRL
jgi:hypothetical protein